MNVVDTTIVAPMVLDSHYSILDSPKVVRERKSKDINFDVNFIRNSPKNARRNKAGENLQKLIFNAHLNDWTQTYTVDNNEYAKGAYGKILLAHDKLTREKVVIKKIPQTTPIRMVNNEVRAGKTIGKHPNIAALLQYNDKPEFHFLVFQFFNGEDLFCYLEKLNFAPRPETEARSTITQVLRALEHIHMNNIAHRDVKLENILIDKETKKVALIDLGLCAFIDENQKVCRDWCGSDNYLAPEIVRRTPYDGFTADVFSTGVVLFALLFGVFPFENLRVNGVSMKGGLKTLKVRFPSDVKVSQSAKDLLTMMLEDDPAKRISVKNVLKHEWILDGMDVGGYSDTDVDQMLARSSLKNSCEATVKGF